MIQSEEISVKNKMGLHMRPLAMIARLAIPAISNIFLIKNGQSANAASIIDMLILSCSEGTRIRVGADDYRDNEIINQIMALFENGFAETIPRKTNIEGNRKPI